MFSPKVFLSVSLLLLCFRPPTHPPTSFSPYLYLQTVPTMSNDLKKAAAANDGPDDEMPGRTARETQRIDGVMNWVYVRHVGWPQPARHRIAGKLITDAAAGRLGPPYAVPLAVVGIKKWLRPYLL